MRGSLHRAASNSPLVASVVLNPAGSGVFTGLLSAKLKRSSMASNNALERRVLHYDGDIMARRRRCCLDAHGAPTNPPTPRQQN